MKVHPEGRIVDAKYKKITYSRAIEKVKELKLNTSEVKRLVGSDLSDIDAAVKKVRIQAPFKKFGNFLAKIKQPIDEESKKIIQELLDEITVKVNALLT